MSAALVEAVCWYLAAGALLALAGAIWRGLE